MTAEPIRTEIVKGKTLEIFALLGGGEGCKRACPRCGGSGHYSFCFDYGTRCFKCNGRTYVIESVETAKNRIIREEREERQRAANGGLTNREVKLAKAFNDEKILREAEERKAYNGFTWSEVREMIEFCEELAKERKKAASGHIGEVGKRLELEVKVVFTKVIEVASYSGYGTDSKMFVLMKSGDNMVKAFGTAAALWKMEKGDHLLIKGTIKEHGEYNGEKNTTLTRVAHLETLGEEVAA